MQTYAHSIDPLLPHVRVRRRVFRQLIESLMFEGVLRPVTVPGADWNRYRFSGTDGRGGEVFYECEGKPRMTFGMVRLRDTPVMRCTREAAEEAEQPALFIREVFGSDADAVSPSFALEVEATLQKDTISACYAQERNFRFSPAAGLTCEALESLSGDGHPYHPCYKSRIGFSMEDHRAYGPEFEPDLHLVWLAARHDDVRCSTAGDTSWRDCLAGEIGEAELRRFDRLLLREGLDPELFRYWPVHPWQWDRHLAERCRDAVSSKRLAVLGAGRTRYRPQQSIRTLANRADRSKSDLKLSLNIFNTSSLRGLTDHSIASAPAVSAWLQQLVDGDLYLKREAGLVLLHEHAGLAYLPAEGAAGCLWRQSVRSHLEEGEEAAPFHALLATDAAGAPFIGPWLAVYGIARWVRRWIRRCMLPVIHLLAAHGVALESHMQNMVLIHREGWPVRVALKDFHEGVEFYRPFLSSPELVPDFASLHAAYAEGRPGDYYEMPSLACLREMCIDALLFMNAGYFAMMLADRFGYAERDFWQLFAEELDLHCAAHPELRARFDALELDAPVCAIEPLAAKRLYVREDRWPRRPAANPLARVRKAVGDGTGFRQEEVHRHVHGG